MIQKTMDLLAGFKCTLAAGVFLALSLFLDLRGVDVPVDPAWAAVFISGLPLLYLAVIRIIRNPGMKKISSALLISIAMLAAIGIGDLFAAGEVAFIMAIGALLEGKTTERAKAGLRRLISLVPDQARLFEKDGSERVVPASAVKQGDRLRVLPGEAVPVDGVIVSGTSSLDQSVITGESLPVDKEPGDEVFCGSINHFGAIVMEAVRTGEDSTLQKLVRMTREAGEKKAPMERLADSWGTWLVPCALLIAIITGLATDSITRAVTVLVVFCPCALVLATPTAVTAAIGQAAKNGVLIKSGEALERMSRVDTVAFDKTGTLTCGRPALTDLMPLRPGLDEKGLLRLAAGVETLSEHPLARVVTERAKEEGLFAEPALDFSMTPSRGVSGALAGHRLSCGRTDWLETLGTVWDSRARAALDKLSEEGKAVIAAADENGPLGLLGLSDTARPDAPSMIQALRAEGANVLLLTGDHERAASFLARQAGITEVRAGLLPEEKVENVRALQEEGHQVCMIGDGVNDTPAIRTASVGVAMGTMGSDMAIDAADIALIGDDIAKIPYLVRLSRACVKTIKFSISLSLAINLVAITLSTQGVLTPTTGALVHNAGSCCVVLIAALLYDRNFLDKKDQKKASA